MPGPGNNRVGLALEFVRLRNSVLRFSLVLCAVTCPWGYPGSRGCVRATPFVWTSGVFSHTGTVALFHASTPVP